jgi:hypothetical protein
MLQPLIVTNGEMETSIFTYRLADVDIMFSIPPGFRNCESHYEINFDEFAIGYVSSGNY